MKVLRKSKREKGLWLEEGDKPSPGVHEILIRVKKTAIAEQIFIFIIGMIGLKKPFQFLW
jgi:hypothetical protein